MFIEEALLYLAESAWALILHLSAKSSFPKPLLPEEEAELVEKMLSGDGHARDKLIEHNLRLVAHITKKYAGSGCDSDDLISIGSIGLIKAVHTFKPEAGKLTTYASRCIENEILMHLRANKKMKNTVSMGDSVGFDKEGNELQLTELLGTDKDMVPDEVSTRIDSGIALQLIDRVLDEREARVIRLRYGLEDGVFHAQHEVAKLLGISRSYVSRIEKKALGTLKKHME
ncbi:MAG: RNA polymerase sporulation sigma factor SigK [Clostridia bacterium]|nr:RNA polymerase sporulation sigma factor SigK [Clostridia bacterium]